LPGNGDTIVIDIPNRIIRVDVPDAVLRAPLIKLIHATE